MKFSIVLIVFWGLFIYNNCVGPQDYVVSNDQLEPIDSEGETLIEFANLNTVGRQHFVNGSIIFIEDMDDEHYQFSVEMYTSPNGDGDYKKMAMDVPKTGVCEGFKKFYKEFVQPSFSHGENTNIPFIGDDGLCPLPAGEYFFKDIQFNTDTWPNQMPRGTLKIVITFYKDDIVIGGLLATLKIEDDTR